MKSVKNLFILTVIFSFLVSVFWSFLVINYMQNGFSVINQPIVWQTQNSKVSSPTNPDLKTLQSNVKAIASNVSPAVVNIIISKDVTQYRTDPFGFFQQPSWTVKKDIWWWSGFFVTKNGLILTNKHVVSDPNASYTIIEANWDEYSWKVLALDPSNDLAIIKAYKWWKEINDAVPANFISDSSSIQVWDFIVAIWNALAQFQNTVTFWVISGLWRDIQAWDITWWDTEQLSGLIQTDAAINPGNSGWPLVNLDWNVVWINTAVAEGANWLWFAIPLSQKEVNYLIQSVQKYWSIKRAFLWIKYFSLNKSIQAQLKLKSDSWDYIPQDNSSIIINWPAYKAWIMPWDIIVMIDSTVLWNWVSIKDVIKNKFPGDKVRLKIIKPDWKITYVDLILWQY